MKNKGLLIVAAGCAVVWVPLPGWLKLCAGIAILAYGAGAIVEASRETA